MQRRLKDDADAGVGDVKLQNGNFGGGYFQALTTPAALAARPTGCCTWVGDESHDHGIGGFLSYRVSPNSRRVRARRPGRDPFQTEASHTPAGSRGTAVWGRGDPSQHYLLTASSSRDCIITTLSSKATADVPVQS